MDDLIFGAPIVALVPGVVELAKHVGLPTRYAGLAAVVGATALVALADLAVVRSGSGSVRDDPFAVVAGWLLAGIVYGLAAAGLYSQARRLPIRLAAAAGVEPGGDADR